MDSKVARGDVFTKSEVLAMMELQNQRQVENLMQLVKELKKPTDIEQKKLDEDARKLKSLQDRRLKEQTAEVQAKENKKKFCPHGTTHPGTHSFHPAWVAQVNSDGNWWATCQQCWTQIGPIRATQYELQNGVNLNLYRNIDVAMLERLGKERSTKGV